MKSIVIREFGGTDVLRIEDTDRPSFGDDEIMISSYFASVNFADIQT